MADTDGEIESFRAKCKAMREERASKWGDIEIELPPVLPEPEQPKPVESLEKQEARRRELARRMAMSASGSLLRRIADSEE